jgi:hypothetical protein
MRSAVLFFGVLGFVVAAVAGFSADRAFDLVLRDAALGCLLMAFAGRWFWGVFDQAFADTIKARRATAEAQHAAAAEAAPATPSPSAKTQPARSPASPKPASASR